MGRHHFYTQVISMIGESIDGFIANAEKAQKDTQAQIDNADDIKAENVKEMETTAATLESKQTELTALRNRLNEEEDILKTCQKDLNVKATVVKKQCAGMKKLEAQLEESKSHVNLFEDLKSENDM